MKKTTGYDKELMARRDQIAAHLRTLNMYCLSQVDMTKASNGATLFMECWTGREGNCKVILLIVDKFGGICTYRPCTGENSMGAELRAISEYCGPGMERCNVHRSSDQCELTEGHSGNHRAGGLEWGA
jgi:hypothetical protein